jgi:membrane protein implicated in regulation of membrane protease activity
MMEISHFKLDLVQLAAAIVTVLSFILAHRARKKRKESENGKSDKEGTGKPGDT